jgi:hypothetical protein
MLGVSMFSRAEVTDKASLWSVSLRRCIISIIIHIKPKHNRIAIKGGKWVMVLNTGTKIEIPMRKKNTKFLSKTGFNSRPSNLASVSIVPFNEKEIIQRH